MIGIIIGLVIILILIYKNDNGDDNLPPSINDNESWTGTIDI
jgi:hypothetical protein